MENFKKINIEQIVSIKTYIGYESTAFEYRLSPKYFSFLFPKEGFYNTFTLGRPKYTSQEEIEKSGQMFCEDKKVMYYPHIEIRMSNQSLSTKYFKTEEDLKEFYDENLAQLNLIDL